MNWLRNIGIRYVILSIVTIFAINVNGQTTDMHMRWFDVQDGLSESSINCMIQDSRGYIWIGTSDGLNRYDGHSFFIFRNKVNNPQSICDNIIRSLCEDKLGNIWIGTSNGLSKFDRKAGYFINYFHSPDKPSSLSDNSVFSVYVDSRNTLWVKTYDVLEQYDEKTDAFKHFKPYNNVFNRLPLLYHNIIFEDMFEQIWLGTKDGLQLLNLKENRFELFTNDPIDPMSISNTAIRSIFEDAQGNLWVGTDNGLNQFIRKSKSFRRYLFSTKEPYNQIQHITQDSKNVLWIGSDQALYKFNSNSIFQNEVKDETKNVFESIKSIRAIVYDGTEILWVGTAYGLLKIDTKPLKFQTYRIPVTQMQENTINYITSFAKGPDNFLYLGTWGKGIQIFDSNKRHLGSISSLNRTTKMRLDNDKISTMLTDSRGLIWIGSADGLYRYDVKAGTLSNFAASGDETMSIDYFENNRVNCMYESDNGHLWVGADNGFYNIDPKTNQVSCFFQLKDDSLDVKINSVYSITGDSKNNLYIGTDRGLLIFNPILNDLKYYHSRVKNTNKIGSNIIFSLHLANDTNLWIGTNSGLEMYNTKTENFTILGDEIGVPNSLIYSVLGDLKGNIWIGTNRGLGTFHPQTNEYFSFDHTDGLQGYKFNQGASYLSASGELFFGGTNGFNAFYPDSIHYNPFIPNIVINYIEIVDKEKNIIKQIDTSGICYIPHQISSFSIYFSALDFTIPEKNNYAYQLVNRGENGEWIRLGTKHVASFYNLPSGEYTFRLRGSNNDNVWNERGVSLVIIIETPFWQTTYAYILYILLIGIILYAGYMYRTRSLRSTNKILREREQASLIVARQKEELSIKNKNITDSIYYAKRIQDALMPSDKTMQRLFPESFVYLRPRDIVSGDFYWLAERNDKVYIAAVDCTGHGVPGAIMSILGFEMFRNTFNAIHEDNAALFLDRLSEELTKYLSDEHSINLRDGMDVAMCIFDKEKSVVQFAGAMNPLYLIRDNKIIDFKANRFSVSMYKEVGQVLKFSNNEIFLKKDDVLYLFSDGYADQFGGPEEKKYKHRRFRHLLLNIHRLPMNEQSIFLDESIENWKGDLEQVDDILIIGIKNFR